MLLGRFVTAIDAALEQNSPPCGRCGGQHGLASCPADSTVSKKGTVWQTMGSGVHAAADEYLKKHAKYKYVPTAAGGTRAGGARMGNAGGRIEVGGDNWGGFNKGPVGAAGRKNGPSVGNTPAKNTTRGNGRFDQQQHRASQGYASSTTGKLNDVHIRGSEYTNSTEKSGMYYPHRKDLSSDEKKPSDNGKAWSLPKELKNRNELCKKTDAQFAVRQNFFQDSGNKAVLTNHFEYKIDAKTVFYKYRILDLNTKNRKTARTLVEKAIEQWNFLAQNKDSFATNYFDTIVSWKPLHSNLGETNRSELDGVKEWNKSIKVGDKDMYLRFCFVKHIPIHDFERYAVGDPNYEDLNFEEMAACINLVISKSFTP